MEEGAIESEGVEVEVEGGRRGSEGGSVLPRVCSLPSSTDIENYRVDRSSGRGTSRLPLLQACLCGRTGVDL